MITPCPGSPGSPGSPGCRCPYCYGLREYMVATTGADYGLPATFKPWRPAPEPKLAPTPARPSRALQPWEPRPARQRAA